MDAHDAMQFAPSPGVLLVGSLMEPFYGTDGEKSPPTLGDPHDYTLHYEDVYISLQQVWFFDTRTGRVIQKSVRPTE